MPHNLIISEGNENLPDDRKRLVINVLYYVTKPVTQTKGTVINYD